MPQLLVRDVPDGIVEGLKARAKANGRSAEAEHRAILREVIKPEPDPFWEDARRLREETRGRIFTDSADLIREDRDSR